MAKKKEVKQETVKEEVKEEVLDKKALKAKKKKEQKKKVEGLWAEFKKFVMRGNVVDMSIGVIIGGAFGAIVTALTNILLNVCTWGVPGGLKGLFTVLPPLNPSQEGQYGQTINLAEYAKLIEDPTAKSIISSQYTLHGSVYIYNGAAIIDWGAFINAVISFLVIALTLFIIIKIVAKLQKASKIAREKALEEYYKKHPDERPAPVEPGVPEPTDHQLLKGILAELQAQNKSKAKKAKNK